MFCTRFYHGWFPLVASYVHGITWQRVNEISHRDAQSQNTSLVTLRPRLPKRVCCVPYLAQKWEDWRIGSLGLAVGTNILPLVTETLEQSAFWLFSREANLQEKKDVAFVRLGTLLSCKGSQVDFHHFGDRPMFAVLFFGLFRGTRRNPPPDFFWVAGGVAGWFEMLRHPYWMVRTDGGQW